VEGGRREGGRRKDEGGRRKEEGGRRKEEGRGKEKGEGERRREKGERREEGRRATLGKEAGHLHLSIKKCSMRLGEVNIGQVNNNVFWNSRGGAVVDGVHRTINSGRRAGSNLKMIMNFKIKIGT
jgi:hypothetical protein